MSLRRVSVLALAMLSLGGGVASANPNNLLPQKLAQTLQTQTQSNRSGLIQELNLTSDQVQRMQAVRQQYKDQIAQTSQRLRQAQQELQTLMASTATANQVRDKHRQVVALQQQLGELRFESTLALRELLTPQQRIKYVEHMQKHQQKAQKRLMPKSQ